MLNQQSNQNEVEAVAETKLFNSEDIEIFPSGRHTWRQQGPYIVCKECPLHHAIYIGMEKVMVGEDEDGTPILRDRASI